MAGLMKENDGLIFAKFDSYENEVKDVKFLNENFPKIILFSG